MTAIDPKRTFEALSTLTSVEAEIHGERKVVPQSQSVIFLLCAILAGCGPAATSETLIEDGDDVTEDGRLTQDIGIETLGGVFTPLLEVGCDIPCSVTQTFSTADDGQDQISISLFRGVAERAIDNTHLGRFEISGIPKAPRGEPIVMITIEARKEGVFLFAKEASSAQLTIHRVE